MSLNVAACLPEMAARHPDKVAIRLPHDPPITYRELDVDSDTIARGLFEVGIGRGMRTVLMVPPGRDFFALAFGMAKAGVVPVMVDPGMGLSNLKRCLTEAEPEAFIGAPKAHVARFILGWGRETIRISASARRLRAAGRSARGPALVDTQPDDMAAILFTSGSTGSPKGVVYTHRNFAAQIESLRRMSDLGPDEVDLATFPPFALFDPALGMTTVVPEMNFSRPASADPARIVRTLKEHACTNLFCSPALLGAIARWAVPCGVKLPSLRRVVSAGAPVPVKVVEQFTTLLCRGARILTPYGATEALPVAVLGSDELLGEARARTETGSGVCVGRPVTGVDVAIVNLSDDPIATWDEGLRLPAGQIGEIVVRGPVVTRSYYHRPRETALAKIAGDASPWHRMGDVGYLDEGGRLWFCGRKSQRIGSLFTIPVEAVFNTHPRVRRTALVRAHERPVLCVELEPGSSKKIVTEELLTLGLRYPHTAAVRTILFHRAFPVDRRHNAKIAREALGAWAEAKLP